LPIPIDEEVALAKKVHDGEGARLKMVDANQSLVSFLGHTINTQYTWALLSYPPVIFLSSSPVNTFRWL
jgi:hypothetical protein